MRDNISRPKQVRPPQVKPNIEGMAELKTFRIDLYCGSCSAGRLFPTGLPKDGKTLHTCDKCGRTDEITGDPYPRTVVKRVNALPKGYQ